MEIDADAPAVARSAVEIDAPPETVWDILAAIPGWPSWNADVASASLDGPLAPGSEFRWKAGPGTITSTLRAVERPRLIAWTGSTFGIRAVHVHHLEPRATGTLVRSEESWDGLVVRLLRRPLAKRLREAVESGLQQLKREAERRARTGGRAPLD